MPQASLRIPPRLDWVGWRLLWGGYFLVYPEMFNLVQVRDPSGPLKNICRVFEPLLCCLG